ncbi:5-carboxymethyl-2-hydroxymuconate isomerase [Lutimaribacter marinistellae]|uniref:5-carboxymethyl-2-hydroxymuconate isomerase n=1 Tax=Lutimaribacter marinistellae TaxID=1820329 RepID=A0ABV7TDF7_9RHOB
MPHITLDYSANMEDRTDLAGLCEALRRTASETGVFPLAGIRVRAMRADHVAMADGDTKHGYVDVSVRLRAGRDLDTRKAAVDALFETARSFLEPAMERHSIALSMEMRDIDPDLSPKTGTIRDHMAQAKAHD